MHNFIDSIDALDAWLDAHATQQWIAVDTEFMRTNTFASRLALLQLCIGGEVALVDVVALRRPPSLIARLGDARNPSIMHSAGEDLEALLPLLPDGPGELFDTQIAAAMAGIGFGVSYQKLVGQLARHELAKAETTPRIGCSVRRARRNWNTPL
jgi:ribonuclease D